VKVEILGSGGALTTPRPLCRCRVCVEARERGVPYSRSGPSVFVHGPNALFDTPEEIKDQLNRSRVREIAACVYSHWHPDHVMGRRVFETLNADFRRWPRQTRGRTRVFLPQQVATDFRRFLGSWDHLHFMAERGWIELVEVPDGSAITLADMSIRPLRLAEDYVYAFLLEGDGRRVLLAPDELKGWSPPADVRGVDLAIVPMGICEHDPFTGERWIAEEHPILSAEATFEETLAIVGALAARHTVLTHVEEMDGLSHDDLLRLAERLRGEGTAVTFAYDTMVLEP
jgi:phosphoribosyl 1,2-cyclic phosphate phosphodiesterase